MNETITKFGYPGSLIREYQHWVVLLRPQQVTLGSLVLAAKSDATALHQLEEAAFSELKTAVTDIESVLGEMLAYERMNYLMLMMVDPHVHYHVIPRYEGERQFSGLAFPDASWPGPPALNLVTAADDQLLADLTAHLKDHWPA